METGDTIRLQLTLHYDGSLFHGWQLQPDRRTVQGELEAALSRLADQPRTVIASGRTDSGVHATGQVAAVDMPPSWTAEALRRSLNAILPSDMWIESAHPALPDFHPRYDAVARTYVYRIGTEPRAASPFHRRWCWPLRDRIERDLLVRATVPLVGEHSFRSFSKAGQPERGDRCTVRAAGWTEWALGVRFEITADRYLHHMVRYLVGTLVDVARGRRPIEEVSEMLEPHTTLETSPPAPPQGLFLAHVEYPHNVTPIYDDDDPQRSGWREETGP